MGSQGSFRLRANGPYNFDLSYSFYRRSKFEMVDRLAERFFVRPILADNVPVLIQIRYGGNDLIPFLNIRWRSPKKVEKVESLRQLLARMFYIEFDLEKFYAHPLDQIMRKLTRRFIGFRPILTPNVFEAAAWAIIGQQVNLSFAYRLKSRLVRYVNRTFTVDGIRYHLFPSASEVADIDYNRLRSMQLSGRKAEYLLHFARMAAGGEIDLEHLADLDYESGLERLLSIRGIGPWSANYILMRGAGHQDAFPIGDSGINRAVSKLYGWEKRPHPDRLAELGERWRPYRSLATFYLWKSL